MAQRTRKFSVFLKILTCSLLSYTFLESWETGSCKQKAVRVSRLLTRDSPIITPQQGQYSYLKNKVLDLLNEEHDSFGRIYDLTHGEVFRNPFTNLIHEDRFRKKSYRNLDASSDDMSSINEFKRALQEQSKGINDSLDIDCFYDDEASSNTPSAIEFEGHDKSRSSHKSLTSERKNKQSTGPIQFTYKVEENLETLKEMVRQASAQGEPSEGGILGALKKFDRQFEVELLRSVNDKCLSDYDECKYKTLKGRYQHFMKKFKIYLPPTVTMFLIMLMLVFKSLVSYQFIAAWSIGFFTMIVYYLYKLWKISKIKECYKRFNTKGKLRKPSEY
ncbi:hypothetical protein C922_02031 [Plasmodium inui San Antonio 1]|uniref:Pv-fam-d protein n=1 Tax=Plasmodium inui San Antonio 1 TaxID=1237626 RepID=W7A3L8_9APIC|nr:hypothetical protein C922_02031 [Plasmodium inui San Antonio 1]EUD67842.1 hypothetical protein C922_02031 [Plasmodium inui San Antonio 1]